MEIQISFTSFRNKMRLHHKVWIVHIWLFWNYEPEQGFGHAKVIFLVVFVTLSMYPNFLLFPNSIFDMLYFPLSSLSSIFWEEILDDIFSHSFFLLLQDKLPTPTGKNWHMGCWCSLVVLLYLSVTLSDFPAPPVYFQPFHKHIPNHAH